MVTRIAFPTVSSVDIRNYPDISSAERSTSDFATGSVYIFAEITQESIKVLNLGQMDVIMMTYRDQGNKITLPKSKEIASRRLPGIIATLAQEATKMATQTKDTKKKVTAAKDTEAKTPRKAGRTSDLAGKKLFKTGKREEGKGGHSKSRRSASYALIKKGMKYETALEAGVHKDDIAKLLNMGHIEAK